MNWSTSTKCPGGNSSFKEPQAEIETRSVTPARFKASILARKLMADGRQLVAAAVARQEAHRQAVDLGEQDLVGGFAPG